MAIATEPKCAFCDRNGLLLMPVRYAIAPLDVRLPAVSAPLKVEDAAHSVGRGRKQDLTLHGSAQYTARLLRSGYLYVYDEKRDRMDAYWVTQDGYFMSFPPETVIPAEARSARPCHFKGHTELAGCIAIDDAEQAGIVWLGFSDVQWTPAIIGAHRGSAGKAQRELHMRAFDAGAWARAHKTAPGQPASPDRGSTPHAVAMTALASTVADYAPIPKDAPGLNVPFTPLSAPTYRSRTGQAEAQLDACRRRSPRLQGAIVSLDDPAGVTQDFAALIQWHQDRLLDTRVSREAYGKGYGYATTYRDLQALESSILTLRASNDEKVKMQVFSDAQVAAGWQQAKFDEVPGIFWTDKLSIKKRWEIIDSIRDPSPQAIQAAQTESWNDYLDRTVIRKEGSAYNQWKQAFNTAYEAMQKQHVAPLATTYVAWLQSNLLANKLECTHDGNDPLSGDVYAETLQRCMAATQQIPACSAVFEHWLKGDITDKMNVLLRALVLRQDTLIQAMAAAPLDPAKMPWQTLMDQYTSHVKALLKPDINAQINASNAQTAVAKAKRQYDKAFKDYAGTLASPGIVWAKNPYKQDADVAEAAWKESQAQADEAKRDTQTKLLPDSVTKLLVQASAPFTTMLREHNKKAAEKNLMRWMVVVGITIRRPAGVLQVSGSARETVEFLSTTFVDNLARAAEKSGKPMSGEQIRQLTQYAKRQVRGSFATGNIGAFDTALGNATTSKLTVFLTEDMHKDLATISDPTEKIRHLVANAKSPRTVYEYGVMKVGTRLPVYGAAAEGVLTLIDGICKGVAWKTMHDDEAKALSFQKTRMQDTREVIGGLLFFGAAVSGVGNVAKMYGTWRNTYAMGLVDSLPGDKLVGRATTLLRWTGVVAGAASGFASAMDFGDAKDSYDARNAQLMWVQITSGTFGVIAAGITMRAAWVGGDVLLGGLSLTGWGFVLTVIGFAIGLSVDKVKGDNTAQWLERCYWGNHPRFSGATEQDSAFQKLVTGT